MDLVREIKYIVSCILYRKVIAEIQLCIIVLVV